MSLKIMIIDNELTSLEQMKKMISEKENVSEVITYDSAPKALNHLQEENQIDILKSVLTHIENKDIAKTIIKNYLKKNKVQKIVRF